MTPCYVQWNKPRLIISNQMEEFILYTKRGLLRPPVKKVLWKLFFLFLDQNICCGYSKEPSHWDGSFEHPKHMFKLMGKRIITIICSKYFLISTNDCYTTFIFAGCKAVGTSLGTVTRPWLMKPFNVRYVITRFTCSDSQILAIPRQVMCRITLSRVIHSCQQKNVYKSF